MYYRLVKKSLCLRLIVLMSFKEVLVVFEVQKESKFIDGYIILVKIRRSIFELLRAYLMTSLALRRLT